jgi:regulator of sigma E protease
MVTSRDGTEIEKMVLLRTEEEIPAGEGPLGIQMSYVTETVSYPPWEAIPLGLKDYGETYVNLGVAFGSLFRGEVPLSDAVVGPVGIAHITSDIASRGIEPLITWAVIILVILGIVNLLPIPGLDGGRLVFVIIEGIRRGKRISPKKEGMVHLIGFVMLLALVAVVSYNDIVRLIQGESFLP